MVAGRASPIYSSSETFDSCQTTTRDFGGQGAWLVAVATARLWSAPGQAQIVMV